MYYGIHGPRKSDQNHVIFSMAILLDFFFQVVVYVYFFNLIFSNNEFWPWSSVQNSGISCFLFRLGNLVLTWIKFDLVSNCANFDTWLHCRASSSSLKVPILIGGPSKSFFFVKNGPQVPFFEFWELQLKRKKYLPEKYNYIFSLIASQYVIKFKKVVPFFNC